MSKPDGRKPKVKVKVKMGNQRARAKVKAEVGPRSGLRPRTQERPGTRETKDEEAMDEVTWGSDIC